MAELFDRVRDQIFEAIEKDTLLLPTMPEIALQVRDLTDSDTATVMDLANLINRDAAMSARMIKVCNSPLFRGSREVTNLQNAVSRLGMDYTGNLALGLAMEQMFQATSSMVDQRMRQTWKHSTEVAGIAQVLAQYFTRLKPDQATLAGLVSQIGVLPILRFVEDEDLAIEDEGLDQLLETLHPILGRRILERWRFPESISQVPEGHVDFSREVATADYADVVMVANLECLNDPEHPFVKQDWSAIPAFARLGLNPNQSLDDDEDLSIQMKQAMRFLGA
ncbi:MAG: HDOD domain-containing protein [Halomonadaceae bacterium]|nr:MAG: HDOD domain-containing protein [Halomonadaceae bacterium]